MMGFAHQSTKVIENVPTARDTYRVRLRCPELAKAIRPGQFLMLRWPEGSDPLLGRPFALYDTILDENGEPRDIDVVYLVVGKLTKLLSLLKAEDSLLVWGPLGNGFPKLEKVKHLGMVAGGIGQTPFLAYARQLLGSRGYGGDEAHRAAEQVTLYYGARQADLLAGLDDFREAGVRVEPATDDGSLGYHGYVTELLLERELPQHLVGCGPEPMLRVLAKIARERVIPCHVSLETPMACGIGVCFSCVTKVKVGDGWDYKRVCMDGPVFDASEWVVD